MALMHLLNMMSVDIAIDGIIHVGACCGETGLRTGPGFPFTTHSVHFVVLDSGATLALIGTRSLRWLATMIGAWAGAQVGAEELGTAFPAVELPPTSPRGSYVSTCFSYVSKFALSGQPVRPVTLPTARVYATAAGLPWRLMTMGTVAWMRHLMVRI